MDTIKNSLKANPIFSMSLGSKELFHSNFLEYLWCVDEHAFIKMINDIYCANKESNIPPLLQTSSEKVYKIGREIENFDICVYHKDSNNIVYDIVIENKVKSVPYKEQLDGYVEKAKNKSKNCKFVLLSLTERFPNKDEIKKDWTICGYETLVEKIRADYLQYPSKKNAIYIEDYCNFVEQLVKLSKNIIIPENIREKELFDSSEITKLKEIRLHDLYIKQRCSWFLTELKKELIARGIKEEDVRVINKYADKKRGINLNININQGNGQIAAWICDEKLNVFEVVIQGNQYRHGINQNAVETPNLKQYDRLIKLYKRLLEPQFKNAKDFLDFNNSTNVLPDKIQNFRGKTTISKEGAYCCYGDDYIYRYKRIEKEETINNLLQTMLEDIISIYNNTPTL